MDLVSYLHMLLLVFGLRGIAAAMVARVWVHLWMGGPIVPKSFVEERNEEASCKITEKTKYLHEVAHVSGGGSMGKHSEVPRSAWWTIPKKIEERSI